MKLLPWNRLICQRRCGGRQNEGRRSFAKRYLLLEPLGDRRLLSTMAALPVPSAPAVATAAATLNAVNPTAFGQFQVDLSKAESQSRVTSADVRNLARDEKILDRTIESYSPDANTTPALLNVVGTDVDNSFLESTLPASSWNQNEMELSQLLDQALPTVHISTFVIRDMIDQMKVVARAAAENSQLNDAIANDWGALSTGNGAASVTNLDTGGGIPYPWRFTTRGR